MSEKNPHSTSCLADPSTKHLPPLSSQTTTDVVHNPKYSRIRFEAPDGSGDASRHEPPHVLLASRTSHSSRSIGPRPRGEAMYPCFMPSIYTRHCHSSRCHPRTVSTRREWYFMRPSLVRGITVPCSSPKRNKMDH